ncbi:MAG: hypothetical protein QM791_15250 [Ferruginibacter sp.]
MKVFLKYGPLLVTAVVIFFLSCEKEYSYEGGIATPPVIIDTTNTKPDTTHQPGPGELPPCKFCNETGEMEDFTWSFKTGYSLLCGIDTAIINTERTSFTFFGPSLCAADSGLIFTVYLSPYVLNKDITNLTVSYASFYYYHTGQPYVLSNKTNESFKLTITNYIHSTKTAEGTFSGTGYRQDGRAVAISSGRFKIKLL